MPSSGDLIEKMIGRRATIVLGWVLMLVTLAMLAAMILPRFLSKNFDENPPAETKR